MHRAQQPPHLLLRQRLGLALGQAQARDVRSRVGARVTLSHGPGEEALERGEALVDGGGPDRRQQMPT